jgi:hypothetical protein
MGGVAFESIFGAVFRVFEGWSRGRQIHYGLLDTSGGNVPWTGVQSLKHEAQLSRPPRNRVINGPHWISS